MFYLPPMPWNKFQYWPFSTSDFSKEHKQPRLIKTFNKNIKLKAQLVIGLLFYWLPSILLTSFKLLIQLIVNIIIT